MRIPRCGSWKWIIADLAAAVSARQHLIDLAIKTRVDHKTCRKCKETKHVDMFPSGRYTCKKCISDRALKRYHRLKEEVV